MIPKDGIDLQYVKEAFFRRFWYIVLPFFVISAIAVVHCIKAPRVYKSSTLILVQPQEIPSDYVRSTVTSDARSRLNILQEQVMSRPRLEELIKKYDLYPEIRTTASMYDAVETMRKHIEVNVKESGGRRGSAPAAFEVSYQGQEPVKVRNVTANIAYLFIEDDLKLRERQAAGTSKFLERELERMREELRNKEELVRQFKENNMGLLPEQMENNYRILSQFQQQLDSLNATLQQTEDRKVLLQAQMGRLETLHPSTDKARDESQLSLEELRQRLESLRLRYSDKHPDVARLAARVAKLEKEPQTTVPDSDSQRTRVQSRRSEARRLMLVQREDIITQLKLIDKQIQKLSGEKRQTALQIDKYRQRIENGPKIEQMFVDLRRDYQEASENYQSLLQKKFQAELAENLERSQKGEQFQILEPANLPQKPFKPDIRRILSLGFMLALACGLGLAFVREYLDPTFWRAKDLESVVQLPVLVSVPVVNTAWERRWNLLKRASAAGAFVSMASVLLYALFVLWKMDPTVFPIPL